MVSKSGFVGGGIALSGWGGSFETSKAHQAQAHLSLTENQDVKPLATAQASTQPPHHAPIMIMVSKLSIAGFLL